MVTLKSKHGIISAWFALSCPGISLFDVIVKVCRYQPLFSMVDTDIRAGELIDSQHLEG